jgi:pyruvate/2-oxoglutarate dehydrogenase complex dihydrolipoamide acyltransferase (E2) component
MALVEVKVPDIGDFKEVEIIELLVKPGDAVKAEQSLITVESDKASMEIPSSHAGVVKELMVKLGDKVSEGAPVLMLDAQSVGAAVAPAGSGAGACTCRPTGSGSARFRRARGRPGARHRRLRRRVGDRSLHQAGRHDRG